jgi:putative peptidoglycan lipid II flippase
VQLPLGIVGAIVGIVLLPELAARQAAPPEQAAPSWAGVREPVLAAQNRALELGALVAVPAAVALTVLAGPIAAVLFERGAFSAADTRGTAAALQGLSLGLPFAVAGKVLAQTLFARAATRAALLAVALGLVTTFGAALILGGSLGVFGIGLGVALGCLAHAVALVAALRRDALWRPDARLSRRLGRIGLAGALLGLGLAGAKSVLSTSAAALSALCLGGFAFYAACAWLFGAVTRADVAQLAKKA